MKFEILSRQSLDRVEYAVLIRCVTEFTENRWSCSCINVLLRNTEGLDLPFGGSAGHVGRREV